MRPAERAARVIAAAVDALVYAAVVTAIVFAGSTAGSFAVGGDWTTVKAVLFVLGTLLFGYGTVRLWFATPIRDRTPESESDRSRAIPKQADTRFQRYVERVPPRRWIDVRPRDAASPTVKLFLAGLAVMGVSFCMESLFGV